MLDETEDIDHLLGLIAEKKPDLVEFRLDRSSDLSAVETIGRKKTRPAIATDRSMRDPVAKEKLLFRAASAGFEFVDIDIASPKIDDITHQVQSAGAEVIVSSHDTSKTPSPDGLKKVLDTQISAHSDICKIVTTALHPRDNLSILQFLQEKPSDVRLVSFAMGRLGVPSRVLSPLFGAEFTFASLNETNKTAEGQPTIDDLRSLWQLLGVQ